MSSHYTTEPPPTASVLLHTTAGPIQISLFAAQTPLASRNFLQYILDGYYNSTTFHRAVPGFVIQGGDPTGTGEGGESIYEDREFEIDAQTGEKVVFGDELHSRLRFNRRGLLGMAKMGENTYGSQFFITLADVRAQLDGNSTMFGRVEGDGIYNVVRIAEAENVEGTERPMYPFKITGGEVLEMPKGEPWASMKKRERVAKRRAPDEELDDHGKKKAKTKKKKGKTLLSFAEDGEEDTGPVLPPKAKFNTSLIGSTANKEHVATNGPLNPIPEKIRSVPAKTSSVDQPPDSRKKTAAQEKTKPIRRRSSSSPPPRYPHNGIQPTSKSPEKNWRKPSFHDPMTQLPLKDPESPSRSPTAFPPPLSRPSTSTLNAEIAALKASMRRTVPSAPETSRKKSALKQLIPENSIRGRKRPRPGDTSGGGSSSSKNDSSTLKILNAFKARLAGADRAETTATHSSKGEMNGVNGHPANPQRKDSPQEEADEDEEATVCDLHFIARCQSCSNWAATTMNSYNINNRPNHPSSALKPTNSAAAAAEEDVESTDWMSHVLSFESDRLGKDLTWKRKNEEELVVIDPREKEREITGSKGRGRERGKEREWGGRGR